MKTSHYDYAGRTAQSFDYSVQSLTLRSGGMQRQTSKYTHTQPDGRIRIEGHPVKFVNGGAETTLLTV